MGQSLVAGRGAPVALALVPVAILTVYFANLAWRVSKTTTSTKGHRFPGSAPGVDSHSLPWKPVSLPDDVSSDESEWILAYERVVSHPVPISSLAVPASAVEDSQTPSELINAYAAATHVAFSSTPQAHLMRAAMGDIHIKRTFDRDWIQGLAFENGDIVNGAYKVVYHGKGKTVHSERVELAIEAPPSYHGPVPRGLILAEVEVDEDHDTVTFVNETWMWRRDDEKPTLIESSLGAWFHSLMAGWLITKGIQSTTSSRSKKI